MEKKLLFLIISLSFVFLSCDNELKIKSNGGEISFEYNISSAGAFMELFSAGDSDCNLFDIEEISAALSASYFKNVKVLNPVREKLCVSANLSRNKEDPFSKANLINVNNNQIEVKLNKENLQALYENLPGKFKNYLDMLMAPVFTGEDMTNEEYLDILAEVYGQKIADEMLATSVNFSVQSSSGNLKKYSVQLINILNIEGEIIFRS